MADPVDLSVVIPVYNEELCLQPLIEELELVLERLDRTSEVICIDDASTDRSLEVLARLRETRPFLRTVAHRVNSGESAAQATGFRAARGEVIVTMDADQQNDPADIPALLEALEKPSPSPPACVCGVRRIRQDDWVRRWSSRIANGFRNVITGDEVSDAGCTFRAIRRTALGEIVVFNGMHRFLPTILRAQGYEVTELPVNHRPRIRGESKYGVGNRLWRGIRDCFAMRWYRKRAVDALRSSEGAGS